MSRRTQKFPRGKQDWKADPNTYGPKYIRRAMMIDNHLNFATRTFSSENLLHICEYNFLFNFLKRTWKLYEFDLYNINYLIEGFILTTECLYRLCQGNVYAKNGLIIKKKIIVQNSSPHFWIHEYTEGCKNLQNSRNSTNCKRVGWEVVLLLSMYHFQILIGQLFFNKVTSFGLQIEEIYLGYKSVPTWASFFLQHFIPKK